MNTTTIRTLRALGWALIGFAAAYFLSDPDAFVLYGSAAAACLAVFGFFKRPAEIETPEQEERDRVARQNNRDSQRRVFGSAVSDAVASPTSPHGSFDDDQ